MNILPVRYEWDPAKAETNLAKHSIAFGDVPEAFASPMLACIDQREDYGEERWIALGVLRGVAIVIAYTEDDDEDVRRIISARKATIHEANKYYEAFRK